MSDIQHEREEASLDLAQWLFNRPDLVYQVSPDGLAGVTERVALLLLAKIYPEPAIYYQHFRGSHV